MGLKERFLLYLKANKLNGNLRAVERMIGLSNGAIDKLSDATRKSTINRISIAFPDLNTQWLITGLGDMFAGNDDKNINNEVNAAALELAAEGKNIGGSVPYEFVERLFREREKHDQIIQSLQKEIVELQQTINKLTTLLNSKLEI